MTIVQNTLKDTSNDFDAAARDSLRGSMALLDKSLSVLAVSYTHLDVYKRQNGGSFAAWAEEPGGGQEQVAAETGDIQDQVVTEPNLGQAQAAAESAAQGQPEAGACLLYTSCPEFYMEILVLPTGIIHLFGS